VFDNSSSIDLIRCTLGGLANLCELAGVIREIPTAIRTAVPSVRPSDLHADFATRSSWFAPASSRLSLAARAYSEHPSSAPVNIVNHQHKYGDEAYEHRDPERPLH